MGSSYPNWTNTLESGSDSTAKASRAQDRRKYKHRKVHILKIQEQQQIQKFQKECAPYQGMAQFGATTFHSITVWQIQVQILAFKNTSTVELRQL